MDEEGYPTEEELRYCEKEQDIDKLVAFVRGNWWNGEHGVKFSDGVLQLDTGGWSGNESTISALQRNKEFWKSFLGEKEGGHFYFEVEYYKHMRWIDQYFEKKKADGVKDP